MFSLDISSVFFMIAEPMFGPGQVHCGEKYELKEDVIQHHSNRNPQEVSEKSRSSIK
jgi:hypothetical protein